MGEFDETTEDPVFLGVVCSSWKHFDASQARNKDAPLEAEDVVVQLRYLSDRFGPSKVNSHFTV